MSDDEPVPPPSPPTRSANDVPTRRPFLTMASAYASTLMVTLITLAVVLAGSTRTLAPLPQRTPVASPAPMPTRALVTPTPTTNIAPPEPTATLSPTIPAAGTYPVPDEQVPILMYHYIRPDPGPDDPIGQGLSVSPELFAEHLAYLAEEEFSPISMADLADIWEGRKELPPKPIVLTFDDGYRDFYTNAWPLLREYGFPSTVYLITSVIDQPSYLTREMILEMDATGLVDFGSHTIYHPSLPALADADAEDEIVDSKRVLEEMLGHPVRTFCYPTGAYSDRDVALVDTAGYALAVTTEWDYADPSMNPALLPRIRISAWTTAYELSLWL
jgi:peptidoglycan/xylan/chitin deacetylase (PgdA/CDA1 family)